MLGNSTSFYETGNSTLAETSSLSDICFVIKTTFNWVATNYNLIRR